MRLILFLMLLAFPIAEIWILINLSHRYGWWVLLYLVVVGWLGLQLVREEKQLFSGKMMQSLMQGGNPARAMFASARNLIAGVLLMIDVYKRQVILTEASKAASVCTTRMPRPPPPPAALIMTG